MNVYVHRSTLRAATLAVATALTCLGTTGVAAASTAGSDIDTVALHVAGLRVVWPLHDMRATLPAGTRLTVRVRRAGHAHTTAAHLAFVQVTASGQPLRRIAAATLRHGTFVVRVPRRDATHYALTLRAGSLHHRSWIDTPSSPAPATPTAPTTTTTPAPAPPEPSGLPCTGSVPGTPSAAMHVSQTTVLPGSSVPYSVENTGSDCLNGGLWYSWERQTNSGWVPVPFEVTVLTMAIILEPSKSFSNTALVGPDFAPGHYRLTTVLSDALDHAAQLPLVAVAAELDVVAP
jgi:hypothetical protein